MNLKATDEIVGDPNRPKTRIVEGIYFQPAANLRAERLRYEMQPPFLFPPIQPQGNRQRECEAIMNLTQQQIDKLCGLQHLREQIEAATLKAMTHGIGWVSIDAASADAIAAVDLWAVPTEPENAATLREHAAQLTGCTENDPVMDSDRARVASEAMRQAMKPDPKPAAPPPKSSDGLLTTAPFGQRVGGGRWGAS